MADNVTADAGAGGAVFATDSIGAAPEVHYPITKITIGALDSQTLMSGGNGTVDAGTIRVTVASDSTGVLSVDDNGGSLTVDLTGGGLTALQLIADAIFVDDTASHVAATTKVMGIGAVAVPTDVSVDVNDIGMPAMSLDRRLHVDADITASVALDVSAATVTVSGTVTVTHPQLGGGTESGAQRVTIANDSTGVVTVDGTVTANPASGTIDTVTTVSTVTNLSQMGGVAISLNTGVRDTGTQRVTIATNDLVPVTGTITAVTSITNDVSIDDGGNSITVDSGALFTVQEDGAALTALQLIANPVFVDDAAFTLTTSSVMMQGAIRDDSLSTLTAVEGDAVPLRVGSTGALHVTGAGGGTQFNVDDASGGTDTGTLALVVRDDALTTLTPIDGDYTQLRVNSTGALHVTGAGGGTQYTVDDAGPTVVTMAGAVRDDSLTTLTEVDGDATLLRVSSTGALHVTGGGGGTEYTEDAVTANPIVGTATLMERDDALSTVTPAEADWIGLRGSAEGALWVQDFNSDAILVDTTSIDGKITACDTGAVVLSSGTVTTVSTVTNLAQMGGVAISLNTGVRDTGTQRVTIATDDVVTVDLGANNDVTATLDAETTKVIGTVRMASGGVASGSFASGSIAAGAIVDLPLPAGAATEATLGTIDTDTGNIATSVALIDNAVSGAGFNITQMNGVNLTMGSGVAGTGVQRVSLATDDVVTVDLAGNNDFQGDVAHFAVNSGNPFQLGAQAIAHGTNPTAVAAADRTRLYANRAGIPFVIGGHPNVVTRSARNTAVQLDTALVTIGAGLKIVVTRVSLTVDNSCTVDVDFEVGFGATTVPTAATGAGVAGMLADFMGVAAGGGITIGDGSGILGVGADGEDLRYSNTVPTTGNCTVTVSYYTIES